MSDSTIDGLYIHHTKVGLWFDGPMTNVRITNNIIVDQIADALNFHTGVTELGWCRNNFVRNTGDDGLAMWSEKTAERAATRSTTTPCRRRRSPTASPSTAAPTTPSRTTWSPTRSARAAACTPGRGSAPSRSPGTCGSPTTPRSAPARYELNWNIGLGAIWIYALDSSIDARHPGGRRPLPRQHLQRDHAGQRLAGEGPVLDHRRPLQGRPGRRHRAPRWSAPGSPGRRSFENVDARNVGAVGVNNCGSFHFTPAGSEFSLTDLGGNDGGWHGGRGCCRTPSPATTARRSWRRRRRPRGD